MCLKLNINAEKIVLNNCPEFNCCDSTFAHHRMRDEVPGS